MHQTDRASSQHIGSGSDVGSGSACAPKGFPAGHKTEAPSPIYTAARVYETTRGDMQEVYATEARTEPWATVREREVISYAERDIHEVDPDAKIEIDCRTSSCRIRIYSEKPHLNNAMGDYPFACMARYGTAELEKGNPGHKYADFYILFGEQNLGEDAFLANRDLTCPKYREQWLTFVSKPFP